MSDKNLHVQPAKALTFTQIRVAVFVAHVQVNVSISAQLAFCIHLFINSSFKKPLVEPYVSNPQNTKLNETKLLILADHAIY